MSQTLQSSDYQKLLETVSRLFTDAQIQTKKTINQILIQTYWQIGRQIVVVEQDNDLRAEYGEKLIERLSKDLTKRHGEGFSERNIQRMRLFFLAFKIPPTSAELEWSHCYILSSIKDSKKRKFYLKQTIKHDWPVRKLEDVIHKDKVVTESLALPEPAKGRAVPAKSVVKIPALKAVKGAFFTYEIIEPATFKPKPGCAVVDFGFDCWEEIDLKATPLTIKKKMDYTYEALIEKVIDGDTLWVHFILADTGRWKLSRQKIRLNGIDAPEMDTQKGQAAKAFVQKALKGCERVVIRTSKSDKYDRYLADLWFIRSGEEKFLNQELLINGLAEVWKV